MARYTIANSDISDIDLINGYDIAKNAKKLDAKAFADLDAIFKVMLQNRDRFPNIAISGRENPQIYLERWVNCYCDAMSNLPSKRIASPKTSCTDPAIRIIVQHTQKLSDKEAIKEEHIHNIFMSAENIQGNLLEEYIARNISAYGFLWCNGNIMRAVDFCNVSGSIFLQIKNKNNTENSSSSNIREGTSIEKWYRLGTKTVNGVKKPIYKWGILNDIVSNNRNKGFDLPACNMSEEDYQKFLMTVALDNIHIITGD